MSTVTYAFIVIFIVGVITFMTRLIPFLIFRNHNKTPEFINYLGKALPPAVIGMLIVYCLRSTNVLSFPFGLPELLAVVTVALLHIWKRNNLISILGGTALYMLLIQVVFV